MTTRPESDRPAPLQTRPGVGLDLTGSKVLSERLEMRSLELKDVDAIFESFTDTLTRYMTPRAPRKRSETERFVRSILDRQRSGEDLVVAVLRPETREFLGCCGIHSRGKPRTPELGIWIKEAAHGNGYGREAVTALVRWSEEHLDYDLLLYPVDRNNSPSRRIPEALGGKIIGERVAMSESGKKLDLVIYAISHPDRPDCERSPKS